MKNYAMTITHHSRTSRWEDCKAQTITTAKREATKRFRDDFLGHIIMVAEKIGDDYRIMARKTNGSQEWENE